MTSLQLILKGLTTKTETTSQPTEEQANASWDRFFAQVERNRQKHNRIMCEGSRVRQWIYKTFKV